MDYTKVYSELYQISKMELFLEIVSDKQTLYISAKNSILDVWQGSEYTSTALLFIRASRNSTHNKAQTSTLCF